MANNSEPSIPVTLPRAQGLEHAARQAVQDEMARLGGGNGGGSADLERRVGNLEADTRIIKEHVHTISKDVAVIGTNYATKADVSALSKDVAVIGANYATKSDLAALGNEIHKTQVDLIKWVVATLIAGMSVTAAIVFGVVRLTATPNPVINQTAQTPQQQAVSPPVPATTGVKKIP